MASVDDALVALKAVVLNALAPLPFATTIDVAAGYPNMPALTKSLEQGNSFVGIFPLNTERLTTRFFPVAYNITNPNPTLTATVSGQSITFAGTAAAGYNVLTTVNGGQMSGSQTVGYQTTGSDTVDSVATSVAANLTADGIPASASGAVVTLTGTYSSLVCNVGTTAAIGQEVRRTERQFQVSTYTPGDAEPSPTILSTKRSAIVNAIDTYLATQYFVQFPDTSWGRLKYVRGPWDDNMQRETMLIAHQIFSIEFATIAEYTAAQIAATELTQVSNSFATVATTNTIFEG